MKKNLLFIAALFVASFASAQGTYTVKEGFTPTDNQKVTDVPSVTLEYGKDGGWKAAQAFTADDGSTTYTFCVSGSNNPKDGSSLGPSKSGATAPVTGTYYVLTPTVDGTLEAAIVLNSGKKLFVFEDNTIMSDFNGLTYDAKKYYTISISAKANKAYTVCCDGSKLGFAGFTFTTGGATGVKSVQADAKDSKIFNLSGCQTTKAEKGVLIQDGKKFMNK